MVLNGDLRLFHLTLKFGSNLNATMKHYCINSKYLDTITPMILVILKPILLPDEMSENGKQHRL